MYNTQNNQIKFSLANKVSNTGCTQDTKLVITKFFLEALNNVLGSHCPSTPVVFTLHAFINFHQLLRTTVNGASIALQHVDSRVELPILRLFPCSMYPSPAL
jgi:hypothetical protein